ncbi:FIG01147456: hypothetical protein [hydrothermal vent metagenome]|uniref:AMP nucleosidase n=1 Tax=hydrothermal vent metagenome TaxID=652676 RepID=A0A3B1AMI8_9ZZZZ
MTDYPDKKIKLTIPKPPHPVNRQQKLPWQFCKERTDDAEAEQRIRNIIEDPAYRQADNDVDFLRHNETRGARLQLDYSKPELLLQKQGIEHTIVVFGSTRISEPAHAKRKVEKLKKKSQAQPNDTTLQQQLAVAKRILDKSQYYQIARDFGHLVGESGNSPCDCRVVLMTGGGPGIMEAANRGAWDSNAKTVGLNITLPHEQYPNPYITPGLCFRFNYFALRKLHFLLRAKALVAFPGGYGTLDELFETLTLVQTRKIKPLPIVLIGKTYWQRAINFDFLVEEGVIDAEDLELFWYAETAQEAWDGIQHWHIANGIPLFKECKSTKPA